jgi:hypothetical protein
MANLLTFWRKKKTEPLKVIMKMKNIKTANMDLQMLVGKNPYNYDPPLKPEKIRELCDTSLERVGLKHSQRVVLITFLTEGEIPPRALVELCVKLGLKLPEPLCRKVELEVPMRRSDIPDHAYSLEGPPPE